LIIDIWLFSRIARFESVEIRDERVKLYCKRYKLDFFDTLKLIEKIEKESDE